MDQDWILGYGYRARQWEEWSSSLRIAQTSRFLSLEYASSGSVPYTMKINFDKRKTII
jgi:hypothetical protein